MLVQIKNKYRNSFSLKMSSSEEYYKGLDAYQILEVPRNADKKAIKAAYRKLVAKWHPDKVLLRLLFYLIKFYEFYLIQYLAIIIFTW